MRKFFQIRLASFFIFVLLLCIALGAYTFVANRAKKQKAAVDELRFDHVSVFDERYQLVYDYEFEEFKSEKPFLFALKQSGIRPGLSTKSKPSKWAARIGVDFVHSVKHVGLPIDQIHLLRSFPGLTSVSVYPSTEMNLIINQAIWNELVSNQGLTNLSVELHSRSFSGIELSFEKLKQLEELSITYDAMLDKDFDAFAKAPKLKKLEIVQSSRTSPWSDFSAEGIPIPQVESLAVQFGLVTPPTSPLGFLTRFSELRKLSLVGDLSATGQQFLEHIGDMKKIESVRISAFDGMDLKPLEGLGSLRKLAIDRNQFVETTATAFSVYRKPAQLLGLDSDSMVQAKAERDRKNKMFKDFEESHPNCKLILY